MNAIRVGIVDDHAVVRTGTRQLLASAGDITVAGEADSFGALLTLLNSVSMEVVLLDLEMPGKAGVDAVSDLHRRHPEIRIVVFSAHQEAAYAVQALRAGAWGYVNKSSPPQEILDAVRAVGRGKRFVTPTVAELLAASVGGGSSSPTHDALSPRELETMRLIASGKQLSEIARHMSLSPKTVSVYRARLLAKLGLKNTAEIVHYAIKQGLVD